MKIFSPKNVLKATFTIFVVLCITVVGFIYIYIKPNLPSTEVLKDIQLQVPLRIYSHDGKLIYEYGEKKRTPLVYEDIPQKMIEATLAAEDDRFFKHAGVDYQGLLRAAFSLLLTGEKRQGGSTITMQVVRNYLLSPEKTFLRKINEIMLSFKIEHELTKEEILTLYLNKIYYGNRAYGVAAAAQVYYGTDIHKLTTAQIAMIAGLPKAPSTSNPIINPERSLQRRNYVLRRMHELTFIPDDEFSASLNELDTAAPHGESSELDALYVGEMVRAEMFQRFDSDAYTSGYRVYTTVDSRLQEAANSAHRLALLEYDRRHGYRGPEAHVTLDQSSDMTTWRESLKGYRTVGMLIPALVTQVNDNSVDIFTTDFGKQQIPWEGLSWAKRYISTNQAGPAPGNARDILKPGDIIRAQLPQAPITYLMLAQIPQLDGALVALAPGDGAVRALVGGIDFTERNFNRAIQSQRQPGSSFKPFIYTAALDKDYTPATLVNDAPVVFEDAQLETSWRPENYTGEFYGPTRLREALTNSRNLVSIRLLQDIGVSYAINYVKRFGFDPAQLPKDLSLALGSGTVTPMQMAAGYAVFANGGYRVEPYFIERIEDANGKVIFTAAPAAVCPGCEAAKTATASVVTSAPDSDTDMANTRESTPAPQAERVLDPQIHYQITSMMGDVIKRGTARRAMSLGRNDLAGKTGTTNDQQDAWFSGFHPSLVAISWVGFDQPQPLGNGETGGKVALPMWISFMAEALKGVPETAMAVPPGMVTVRIDPETGLLANSNAADAIFETFRAQTVPQQVAPSL
ncbi:MAG: peptidase, partial [Gammaproteobacteria bacterium RBG_16_57_12]